MEEEEEPEHCTMSTPSSTDSWPLWGASVPHGSVCMRTQTKE